MTRLQRHILTAGALLCLLVLLFPSYGRVTAAPNVINEGRGFVLVIAPLNRFVASASKASLEFSSGVLLRMASLVLAPFTRSGPVMFDNMRTLVELLGIALATVLGYAAARPRPEDNA